MPLTSSTRWALVAAALAVLAAAPVLQAQTTRVNACLTCHQQQQDARLKQPAMLFAEPDIHRESGFRCSDCPATPSPRSSYSRCS